MAANALRGEVELTVGNETYKLVLDVNAFCYIQPVIDMKMMEMVAAFEGHPDDMLVARALFWGALQKYHDCHLVQAGEIMTEAGFGEVRAALISCLAAAFGTEAPEGKKPENPRKLRKTPGTG